MIRNWMIDSINKYRINFEFYIIIRNLILLMDRALPEFNTILHKKWNHLKKQ